LNWMIQGRGFLWSMWLKQERASSMFLNKEASLLCLYLLLLLEEEMELEWLVDNSDKVVGDRRRIIPIIFIWHRWIWAPIKKASEPRRLTAAAAIIMKWSGFLLTNTTETLCNKSGIVKKGIWGSRIVRL
jgi:hypothetical protein